VVNSIRSKTWREADSEQVLCRKDGDHFENRVENGLIMLRGEVIGAFPELLDASARACFELYHAVALASIGPMWGIRF
jgi:hypothetical protein